MKFVIPALAAVLLLLLGAKCMGVHKNLVAERQNVGAKWTDVESALQGRAALVSDLAQTVADRAPSESEAISRVNQACQALHTAHGQREAIQANMRLDDALSRLMLAIENHPRLENSKEYAEMLEALKDAEYQIAVARRKYNEAVEHYNARLQLFPDNIVASLSRLRKIDAYFQTSAI